MCTQRPCSGLKKFSQACGMNIKEKKNEGSSRRYDTVHVLFLKYLHFNRNGIIRYSTNSYATRYYTVHYLLQCRLRMLRGNSLLKRAFYCTDYYNSSYNCNVMLRSKSKQICHAATRYMDYVRVNVLTERASYVTEYYTFNYMLQYRLAIVLEHKLS